MYKCVVGGNIIVGTNADHQLEHQISLFRQWAAQYPDGPRSGEWECDYDGWPELWTVFQHFLQHVPWNTWSQNTIDNILYIIARDNEMEQLVALLATEPERLLGVAQAALLFEEYDAQWQLVKVLGNMSSNVVQAEMIVHQFLKRGCATNDASDPYEYTSRQALMALGRLHSTTVAYWVERAWTTGYEYQRMAALQALYDANAPELEYYLTLAEADRNHYLRTYATQLRTEKPHG